MDHDRYILLLGRFWDGGRMTHAELEELNRLHLANCERVNKIVTGTKETSA